MVNPNPGGRYVSKPTRPQMTLIIYDETPERLHFYLVEYGSDMAGVANTLSNKYVGGDDLNGKQEKAFDKFIEWQQSKAGKAAEVQVPLKAKVREVIRLGIVV